MNIFDDLIDELKKENLLEENTAGKPIAADSKVESPAAAVAANESQEKEISEPPVAASPPPPVDEPVNQVEFFRKRAIDEVAGLQMVEHVFASVERSQKKVPSPPYDDLRVKKALHDFLQVSGDVKSPQHAEGEFLLMQETESWFLALSHRDKQISTTQLRTYCETAKPVLSSQALLALARFYRNSPYSEAVRNKFDLIATRLFSKDLPDERREPVFGRDELIRHLSELYAEWSSVSSYSSDEDEEESDILLLAFKLEDFMNEAESAVSFDELIRSDFFNRLRGFKEKSGERFFAPLVTAATIESNIRIGNRYIELLKAETERGDITRLENKYGFLHDQVISDAASKTLDMVKLLKVKKMFETAEDSDKTALDSTNNRRNQSSALQSGNRTALIRTPSASAEPQNQSWFAAHKWLLTVVVAVFALSVGLYFYTGAASADKKNARNVKRVNLDNSSLKEYVRDARVGNQTFSAVVQPAWDRQTPEKREEIVKKIASFGADKGFDKVQLTDADGKTIGTVTAGIIDIKN